MCGGTVRTLCVNECVNETVHKLTANEPQTHVSRIMELETEVSKISPLKEKINKLKSRVVDLKSEITEYKSTEDRQKQEIDQLKKTVSAAKKENGFIAQQLEDKKAELAVAASKAANVEPPSPMHGLGGLNDGMSSMERYKRLEIENKKLKAELAQRKAGKGDNTKNSDSDDELADELDMAQRIAKSNEEKYLGSQRKVRELELEVKKITEQSKKKIAAAMAAARRSGDSDKKDVMDGSSDDKTDAGATPVPASSAEYEDMKKKMTSEQSKKEALLTRNKKLEVYIKQLQRKLKDKEQRLAKTVNQGVTYSEALKTLRKQVKDREAEIQEREKIRLDAKHATAREQRLVSAAFYEIGMEFQTMLLKMGGRNGGENTSQRSWINKQRAKLSGGGNSGRGNGDLL